MQRLLLSLVLITTTVLGAEWKPLFNGHDLAGWTNVNCAPSTWSVRDGIIVSTGIPTGVLRTLREYEDFIVELEWKHLKAGGNAGFFVHSGALPVRGQPFTKAIEIQIIDRDHPEGLATAHGDVFAIQGATFTPDRPHPRGWMRCLPSERRARPAGEWNHYRVECRDGRVKLAVNGKEVSGGYDCNPRKGFICLESEGSECDFRNLRIQELTTSREAPPETPDLHFVSLYNGVDLAGWSTKASSAWRAQDWILHCAGSGSAELESDKQFADFSLIADWRLKEPGESALTLKGAANLRLTLTNASTGWNRTKITVRGEHIYSSENEKPRVMKTHASARGQNSIALNSGPVEFANIYIRDLSLAPCPAILVAGGGKAGHNSPAVEAKLQSPFGVDFDSSGQMYIVEMTGERVLKVDTNGHLTRIAGTGVRGFAGDGGPATAAQFAGIHNLAVAGSGDIYLADTWNNRIRKIDARTGAISTIAGTGIKGFGGDGGHATNAAFGGIYCVSLDPDHQNLYAADLDNRRIRKIELKSGIVTTVAGNGQKGVPADGAVATAAPLVDPRAVIVDRGGAIFILERSGHALRMVDSRGEIRTIAGPAPAGKVTSAPSLNGPKHLCFDLDGCVIIADTENHVIRRIDPVNGRFETIAGTGKRGRNGVGGPPLGLELNQPHGVYIAKDGTLYIADSSNHRVVKMIP